MDCFAAWRGLFCGQQVAGGLGDRKEVIAKWRISGEGRKPPKGRFGHFDRAYAITEAPCTGRLLSAIDEVDRAREHDRHGQGSPSHPLRTFSKCPLATLADTRFS